MTRERKEAEDSILVLGAGELGISMLRALAELRERGEVPPVSVMLRPRPKGDAVSRQIAALGVDIVELDIAKASVDDLTEVFRGFTRVISCTGFVGGPGTQRKIAAAAVAAGVAHFIPWQFGVDYDIVGRGSGQDVWDEQLDVREMLRSQSAINWTIVSTGMFTSFVFLSEFGLVDLDGKKIHALGDWSHRLTVTTPEDIGRLTARVAARYREFGNQVVYVAGDTFTYRELADRVEGVLGQGFERVLRTVPDLETDLAAAPDDTMRKYRLAFARPDGVAWPKEETFNHRNGIAVTDVTAFLRELKATVATA